MSADGLRPHSLIDDDNVSPAGLHPNATVNLPTPFPIRSIETDNYRTKTFVLDASLNAAPGQFVMAWLPRFDEKPFSLVNADPVTVMVTAVGPFTRLLHEMEPGDRLWLRGAYGKGFHLPRPGLRAAFVGGGYGVAPLLWLARAWKNHLAALSVVIGAGSARDLLYVDSFSQMDLDYAKTGSALQVHTSTEDGTAGTQGRVTDLLEDRLAAGEFDLICACGPHGMLAALDRLGDKYGVPRQLSWEAYMRCGIGICGSCEHEGRVLCLDGPVLQTGAQAVRPATHRSG